MTNESTPDQDIQKNPIVAIEMENGATIKIELYPAIAPETVKNFVTLVSQGFYDGLIFHRVIPGFMIQGGDPDGTGMGGSKQTIRGEFSGNGCKNDLKHERGIISMARTSAPNSASSQIFIVVKESCFLDGQYASFGKVIEGMEEVDRIVSVPKTGGDKPLEDQRMKKVSIQL
ncbi:MAG TPA: peptidylprolyl isomerase [Desulfosporosinus sp.]